MLDNFRYSLRPTRARAESARRLANNFICKCMELCLRMRMVASSGGRESESSIVDWPDWATISDLERFDML